MSNSEHPVTDETQSEVQRVFSAAPFIADLGLKLEHAADGECRTSLRILEKHLQQDGFVHAGVQATIADHTAGAAAATLLRPGQIVLSAEFKINLLRPARGDLLTCSAKVLKSGSVLTVVESEVFCTSGDRSLLVAKATVTLSVLTPRSKDPADAS
jgi:uncharacterized protein (TIGR00369 family)